MKMPFLHKKHAMNASGGFTILEMLAASAVFAMMLVFTLQMLNRTNALAAQTSKQMDSIDGAQMGLDAIVRDMRTMVRTQGFTMITGVNAIGGANHDFIAFLCRGRANGSATMGRYTGVCYIIASGPADNNSNPALLRLQNTMQYGDNTFNGLKSAYQLINSLPTGNAISPVLVSDKIVRMDISYIWKDGTVTTDASTHNLNSGAYASMGLPASTYAVDISQLSALVVGVVAVDQKSQDLLKSSGGISSVIQLYGTASNSQTPADRWSTVTFATNIPMPVRSGVRYLQRTIPVN